MSLRRYAQDVLCPFVHRCTGCGWVWRSSEAAEDCLVCGERSVALLGVDVDGRDGGG